MTTLEIQVPDTQAKKYEALFQTLASRKMTSEDFEDVLLSCKIEEVASKNPDDYMSADVFLEQLW